MLKDKFKQSTPYLGYATMFFTGLGAIRGWYV